MQNNNFYAGLFGGVFGVCISHPLDTLRIRLQLGNKSIKGLYNGILPPLFGVGLEKLLVFGNYDKLKKMNYFSNSYINNFFCGMTTGLICTSIVTPIEKVKINLQNNRNIKIFDLLYPKYLYRGWTSTLIREVPGYGIYFSLYEILKQNTTNFKWYYSLLYGGISGASAWAFIYPSDVIKTRMQKQNNIETLHTCIIKLYKEGKGINIFYKGFTMALLRAFILHSGVFTGYELYLKITNT